MSAAMEAARQESSGTRMYLLAFYYLVTSSVSLLIAAFGVVMVVLGATVVSQVHEVFAGMFGVWGVTFFLLGLIAYGLLWANEFYARLTAGS